MGVIGLMILAVPATVFAYDTYVGLKIESVYNPNWGTTENEHTQWCLVKTSTMTIKDGTTPLNTVSTSTETCPSGTIWSGLVDLTSNTTYTIDLSTFGSLADPGKLWNGNLWYHGVTGETCNTVCADHGTCTMDKTQGNDDANCSLCKLWRGDSTNCVSDYNYPGSPDDYPGQSCYQRRTTLATSCDISQQYRFCTCGGEPLNYQFSFTAPAA